MNPVLVLALNPSIDAEWRVDDVLWEEKNNVLSETRWAGGKGINVARWLNHLGNKSKLILPLGGLTGKELASHLRAEKLPAQIIPLRQSTRVNVIVTTKRGRQIRFNPSGPEVSCSEWNKLITTVEASLADFGLRGQSKRDTALAFDNHKAGVGKALSPLCSSLRAASVRQAADALQILSGSLPRGVPNNVYADLIRLAHRFGVRTLLDCDGAAFVAAIKARPFLVKPNEHELAQWFGKPLRTEKEIFHAARKLSATTRGWVLVSRGGKRSWLVHMNEKVELHATPPRVKPRNTVGAGDALLAAVANQITLGKPPTDWLRFGIETGTAATLLQAGKLPAR